MSSKIKLLIAAVLSIVLIIGASVLYSELVDRHDVEVPDLASQVSVSDDIQDQGQPETQAINTAPDFEMYDIDGNLVSLSDFFGRPIVINFWATWCPACRAEMPDFEAVYSDVGDEVQFLMVALVDGFRETIGTVDNFIENEGYTFPVFYDTTGSGGRAYQIISIPTTIFIDSHGNVAGRFTGILHEQQLRSFVDELLEMI